jgi:hypothetical protein
MLVSEASDSLLDSIGSDMEVGGGSTEAVRGETWAEQPPRRTGGVRTRGGFVPSAPPARPAIPHADLAGFAADSALSGKPRSSRGRRGGRSGRGRARAGDGDLVAGADSAEAGLHAVPSPMHRTSSTASGQARVAAGEQHRQYHNQAAEVVPGAGTKKGGWLTRKIKDDTWVPRA